MGLPFKLMRPCDFYMITDHSDAMGAIIDVIGGAPNIMATESGIRYQEEFNAGGSVAAEAMWRLIGEFGQGTLDPALNHQPGNPAFASTWDQIVDAAEEFNTPGVFPTFIAFEWTSLEAGKNRHRNVIFKDDAEKAGQIVPYTTTPPQGSDNPRDLWAWLQNYEDTTGEDVIAIPHNGNLSSGMTFSLTDGFTEGEPPLGGAYAETRAKWERLYEVSSPKATARRIPSSVPTTNASIARRGTGATSIFRPPRRPNCCRASMPAQGWRASHVADRNDALGIEYKGWRYNAAGITAVWAQENTRAAIFDPMERRETYATTDPRMRARLFGGWSVAEGDALRHDLTEIGYRCGVSMVSTLTPVPSADAAPSFLVYAPRDPMGRISTASRS